MTITSTEMERLQTTHRQTSDYKLKYRLLIVIHFINNKSGPEIAELLHIGKDQVYYWMDRYRSEGIEGLHDRNRPGRPSKIDYDQLKQDLEHTPEYFGIDKDSWTTEAVHRYLSEIQDIEVSRPYIYEVLKKIGYSRNVSRQKPVLPDLRTKSGKIISSLHLDVMYDIGKRLDAPVHRIITESGIKPTLHVMQSDSHITVMQGKTEHGLLTIRYEDFRNT